MIGEVLTGPTTCTKICSDASTAYFHATADVKHPRKPAAHPCPDPAPFGNRSTGNHSGPTATLHLLAEELVSHTAICHSLRSEGCIAKQDLAHESLLGLLYSRKINYQLRSPFLCDSKARRKASWMPFLPEQEREKTMAALLPSMIFSCLSSSSVPKCKEQQNLDLLQQSSAYSVHLLAGPL